MSSQFSVIEKGFLGQWILLKHPFHIVQGGLMKKLLLIFVAGFFSVSVFAEDSTVAPAASATEVPAATASTSDVSTSAASIPATSPSVQQKKPHHHKKKAANTTQEKIHAVLDQVTPAEQSVIEEHAKEMRKIEKNTLSIALFRPTYILPYYYTASPDYAVYANSTPDNQKIMRSEFKGQLSLLVPVFTSLFQNPDWSLNIAYTQLNYWQVYAASQYFREVNYEPEIFIEDHYHRNWLLRAGFDHQSNGRGGSLERSWNRAVGSVQFAGDDWLVSLKVWELVAQAESSNIHNPDIAKFLGYDNLRFSYRLHNAILTLELQNLESGMRRGFAQATVSYPLSKHISLYGQFFSGYGQSLIEYNHRTNAAGIGIAFNDWI